MIDELAPAITTKSAQQRADRVRRLRAALLGDAATEAEIAIALNCSRRKVQRLGLPFERVGRTRLYDVPGARLMLQRRSAA